MLASRAQRRRRRQRGAVRRRPPRVRHASAAIASAAAVASSAELCTRAGDWMQQLQIRRALLFLAALAILICTASLSLGQNRQLLRRVDAGATRPIFSSVRGPPNDSSRGSHEDSLAIFCNKRQPFADRDREGRCRETDQSCPSARPRAARDAIHAESEPHGCPTTIAIRTDEDPPPPHTNQTSHTLVHK